MSPDTYYSTKQAALILRRLLVEMRTSVAFGGDGFPTQETAEAFVTGMVQVMLDTCADADREEANGKG